MRWVLDASVMIKWALPERREAGTAQAEAFLHAFTSRSVELLEPPHWLAEVAAVVSRLAPEQASEITALLHALEVPVYAEADAYLAAVELSVRHRHHLFDTLYHGVALACPDTVLVTADEAYLRRARSAGRIVRLAAASDLAFGPS
jgi:predicted nucleic acid-binding protein